MLMIRSLLALILCLAAAQPLCVGTTPFVAANARSITTVCDRVSGEILGTNIFADVKITGEQTDNSAYIQNIRIEIQTPDGDTFTIKPPVDGGYSPRITTADFKNAGYDQIFYTADSGGSGGFSYSYCFDAAEQEIMFDGERRENRFRADFADGRRVTITDGSTVFYAGYGFRDPAAVAALYETDGSLKAPKQAQVYPIGHVMPHYDETVNRWTLSAYREVCGLCHADKLGNLVERLVYQDGAFQTLSVGFMQPRAAQA